MSGRVVCLLPAGRVERFEVDGIVRELHDPDGPPTLRQLRWLLEHGALALVEPGTVRPLTKAVAAAAITQLIDDEEAAA